MLERSDTLWVHLQIKVVVNFSFKAKSRGNIFIRNDRIEFVFISWDALHKQTFVGIRCPHSNQTFTYYY